MDVNFDLFGDSPPIVTGPRPGERCPVRRCQGTLFMGTVGWICDHCDYRRPAHEALPD